MTESDTSQGSPVCSCSGQLSDGEAHPMAAGSRQICFTGWQRYPFKHGHRKPSCCGGIWAHAKTANPASSLIDEPNSLTRTSMAGKKRRKLVYIRANEPRPKTLHLEFVAGINHGCRSMLAWWNGRNQTPCAWLGSLRLRCVRGP